MPHDLWIFAYGSLMWRPGFAVEERVSAVLAGYRRCFCITSTHHRGSAERPGLVLGLDRGGSCRGVAYRVAAANAATVHRYLRGRELVNGVYREAFLHVELLGSERRAIEALAYVVERAHPSYAGALPLAVQARMIRGARGLSGDNLDYLVNTVTHLRESGIRERELERLVTLAGAHIPHLTALRPAGALTSPCAAALRRVTSRLPIEVKRLRPGDRRRFLYRVRLGDG